MINRNNTSTNGCILCSDCKHGMPVNPETYICLKEDDTFDNVGVCRDFIERKKTT